MIEQIAELTGTRIEIEVLRPLALKCARKEHKDAWTHTMAVLKAKMACGRKPTIPNRYAATILAKALESPALPPAARQSQAPVPPVAEQDDEQRMKAYLDTLVPEEVAAPYAQAEEVTSKELRKKKECVATNFAKIVA